jgi:hypothetical protein
MLSAGVGCTGYVDGTDAPGVGPSSDGTGSTNGGGSGASGGTACGTGVLVVGGTPLQRLTARQYANSVRDLLGVSSVRVEDLAADEKFGTFAANIHAGLSDLGADQYMRSAEAVAQTSLAQAKWDVLVPCDHAALGDEACAGQYIEKFGKRAYRRPLAADEMTRYKALYSAFASNGYDNGIRVVTEAMLQSPHFLYRLELGPTGTAEANTIPLTQYELATRLAFFLWNSTPDDALLSAADSAGLSDQNELQTQAARLLADARARDTLASFHEQWLDLHDDSSLLKDPDVYPDYTPELAAAMSQETVDFADYVMRRGDGKLSTLLTAPLTIAGDALLRLYGAARPAGQTAQEPVALDPRQRVGILTQASFLATHAHSNQSSLVKRGKVVLTNVLCQAVPEAPANLNITPPDPAPGSTTRELFVAHETDPTCAACHKRIDGIGFAFENFDGMGRFRQQEGDKPVDATGAFVGTSDLDGPIDGATDLVSKLAQSPEVHRCLASQWFDYALGRTRTEGDDCSLRRVQTSFADSGQDLKRLLLDIVASDSFRYRASVAGEAP